MKDQFYWVLVLESIMSHTIKGRKDFWLKILHPDLIEWLLPMVSENPASQVSFIRAQLLGEDHPYVGNKRMLKRLQLLTKDLFGFYKELDDVLAHMDFAKAFIEKRPPPQRFIPSHEYLRYHVTHFLEELYILTERIDSQLRYIKRKFQKIGGNQAQLTKIDDATKDFTKAFDIFLGWRGGHVHEFRFSAKEIDHLGSMEMYSDLLKAEDPDFVNLSKEMYKISYVDYKKIWLIKLNRLRELVDVKLDEVYTQTISSAYIELKQKYRGDK